MIFVMGHLRLKAGALAALAPTIAAQMRATREEPGCDYYSLAVDVIDADRLMIHERWIDGAALANHAQVPGTAAFLEALGAAGIAESEVEAFENGELRDMRKLIAAGR